MTHRKTPIKAALVIPACGLLAACGSDTPTETKTPLAARYSVELATAGLGGAATGVGLATFDSTGLESLHERLLPALPDREFAAKVESNVAVLKTQLTAGNLSAARLTLAETRAMVDEYALNPQQDTSIGDVGAIGLALAAADRVLTGETTSATQP